MTRVVKNAIQQALGMVNLAVIKHDNLAQLREASSRRADTELLLKLPDDRVASALRLLKHSPSQLRQDIFVLSELNFKREGFFVEFGAADGLYLSNTYLLEHEFGWHGIVAEPARSWHPALCKNRQCRIETQCVWSSSDKSLVFNEVQRAEFSTLSAFSACDGHRYTRRNGTGYSVRTISLLDLLSKYDAPAVIDYLSIDTEGSEFQILRSFDFNKYKFRIITCEHNFTSTRDKIYALLTSNGYMRKCEDISEFDDWYVLQ
jgi:FkbM family methyltransferase